MIRNTASQQVIPQDAVLKYKSKCNVTQEKAQTIPSRQSGRLDFELEGQRSLRATIPFKAEFPSAPRVFCQIVIDVGTAEIDEFALTGVITTQTTKSFVYNIQNSSETIMKGSINWIASVEGI
jgi:hypothetical protein